MYTIENSITFPLCILCTLMPQIILLFTLTLVHTWYYKSTRGSHIRKALYLTTCIDLVYLVHYCLYKIFSMHSGMVTHALMGTPWVCMHHTNLCICAYKYIFRLSCIVVECVAIRYQPVQK